MSTGAEDAPPLRVWLRAVVLIVLLGAAAAIAMLLGVDIADLLV